MSLTAKLELFCNFSRSCLGQPEKRELQEAELERTKADMLQIHTSVFVVNRKKMAN